MLLTYSHSPLRAAVARRGALLALVALLLFVPQVSVFAQNGSYVKPGITLGEFFDDNLFMVPGATPEADLVSRVSPALEVGYRAQRGHLIGNYNFDAEIYPNHRDLNTPFVRQNAGLDLQYQFSPKVSFTTLGSYDRTHTPVELNLIGVDGVSTGLAIGRFEADQIMINPGATAQITGRTKAVLDYRWSRSSLLDTFSSWISDADARIEHQATGTTMVGVGYGLRQFGFVNASGLRTQRFLLGIGHSFSPLTTLEVWAGPRISPGEVRPELTATLTHRLQRGKLTMHYGQQQGTTLGTVVPLEVQNADLQLTLQTSRRVSIALTPGLFRTTDHATLDLLVYAIGGSATVHLTPQLALMTSYRFSRQVGTFADFDRTIRHQIALISFVITPLRGVEF